MKKIMRIVVALIIVLLANTLPASAVRGGHGGHFAHGGGHGHVSVGFFVGPELWWPGWWEPYPYYPYYPYYPQQPVIVQPQPDVYVQPAPQGAEPYYWYFCQDAQGYYPYVKKCPKGWMKEVPPASPEDGEE